MKFWLLLSDLVQILHFHLNQKLENVANNYLFKARERDTVTGEYFLIISFPSSVKLKSHSLTLLFYLLGARARCWGNKHTEKGWPRARIFWCGKTAFWEHGGGVLRL